MHCAHVGRADRLQMADCSLNKSKHFLCEKNETPDSNHALKNGTSERKKIHLPNPMLSSGILYSYSVCPSGHLARAFLACDVRSACWQNDSFDGRRDENSSLELNCQSHLSTLFACRTGGDRVSYSLVCDHSQDCLDASDEDFCVYPPCSATEQFKCVNEQVRHTGGERHKHAVHKIYIYQL